MAQSDVRQIVIWLLVRSQILGVSAGLGGSVGRTTDSDRVTGSITDT